MSRMAISPMSRIPIGDIRGFVPPVTISQPPMPVNPAPNDEELIAQQFQALLASIRQNGVSPDVEQLTQQNYQQGQGSVQPQAPRVSYGFPELRQGGINTPGVDADIAQRESEAYTYDPQHPQHPGLWAGPPGGSQAGIDFANSMREGRQAASRERALGNVTPENIDEATGLLRGYGTPQEQSAREAFRAAQGRDAATRAETATPNQAYQDRLAARRESNRVAKLGYTPYRHEVMTKENERQDKQFKAAQSQDLAVSRMNAAIAMAAPYAQHDAPTMPKHITDALKGLSGPPTIGRPSDTDPARPKVGDPGDVDADVPIQTIDDVALAAGVDTDAWLNDKYANYGSVNGFIRGLQRRTDDRGLGLGPQVVTNSKERLVTFLATKGADWESWKRGEWGPLSAGRSGSPSAKNVFHDTNRVRASLGMKPLSFEEYYDQLPWHKKGSGTRTAAKKSYMDK